MKNVTIYIDLAFCFVVLPLMILIFPAERWFHNFPWYMVMIVVWLYSVYALNRTVSVPFLFKNKERRIFGVLLIIMSVVITLFLSLINLYDPKPNIHDIGIKRIFPSVLQYKQMVWSLFMIVEAFSFAVGLLTQANEQRAHRLEVEAQRDKAQLAQYKEQIKPHFMFNTLNSLYGLFLLNDPKALPSLEKYIAMLRYVYTTSSRDLIPLADEVEYIRKYVDLQSLRLNEKTKVNLKIGVSDDYIGIPPMLIVSFIENCFKHGVSSVEESSIDISLTEYDGTLILTTRNRIYSGKKQSAGHLGISNCKKRLELIYPKCHKLCCAAEGDYYNVKLSINIGL